MASSSQTLPKTMKAVTFVSKGKAAIKTIPLPTLRPTYILARVHAVALNPTDWKHIAGGLPAPNSISGCDFAGEIIEIGSGVSRKDLKVGDRIAGTTHGGNASQVEDGCFAEYCVVKGDLAVKIPQGLEDEKAATLCLGAGTVGQGLYQKALKLALPTQPTKHGEYVLIYGGSTATGSLGVQFAKLSGYKVISTSSKHNHDLVRSLGAEAVSDYNDPDCAAQIKRDTGDSLKLIWDTVSLPESAKICADALSSQHAGAKYGSILPVKFPLEDVETTSTLMYTIFDEPFTKFGQDFPASKEDFEFARKWFGIVEKLLAEGKLKTHPERVGKDGLVGVLEGLREMKAGKVSGKKLVYRVAETPAGAEGKEIEL